MKADLFSPRAVLLLLLSVALVIVAVFGGNYWLRLASTAAMYVVLASSWNVIGGFTGYPSFATAAFFGLGAYVSAIAQAHGWPMATAWIVSAVVTAAGAYALGLALLRLKGHYFAVGSLVVAEVLREIMAAGGNFTGGGMGLNLPLLATSPQAQGRMFLAIFTALALFAVFISWAILRSRFGMGLRCIEQNEAAASMLGVNTTIYKSAALAISALLAGLAGAVYANWINYIDPSDAFNVLLSVKPIVMALLGGIGTVTGPILGAVGLVGLEEIVTRSFLDLNGVFLGLAVVALVLYLPNGVNGLRFMNIVRSTTKDAQ
jgi:branched-chain amino acid transport system permease protein